MAQKKNNVKNVDYRKLRQELDAILLELQEGDVDIDAALDKYKRGQEIIQDLQKFLNEAQNQVQKLKIQFKTELK